MSSKRRFGRPGGGSLLGMMIINGLVAAVVLLIVFVLFDIGHILEARLAAYPLVGAAAHWSKFWPMLPGASIGFGCLWYWLVLVGRSRGVPWGGALLYGVLIAMGNVPFSGFLAGLLHGSPLMGLVLALIALLSLLLMPSLLLAMLVFGATMGAFNGLMAQGWIERHRPH
ncbi:MAG TPA: hypothetical protein VFB38_08605 [Chthonomonadaceae bacterium]|nr:hypothetical protein [Chthonomonadaceae bacterium]